MSGDDTKVRPDPLCPLCGAGGAGLRPARHPLPVWRCACGMVFLHPHPSAKELLEIYRSDYYRSWGIEGKDDGSARAMKQETFRRRLALLAGMVPPGRVLDVGCATGYFLEVAASAGWDVHGVELSEFAAALARRSFGARIFNGTLEQADYPEASFDLVTLSDLLEHIPEPRSFLGEVRRVLAPDGVLLVVTPDVASLSARLMGRRWSHYKKEHLHYFSPRTIVRLLNECGFQVQHCAGAAKCLNIAYAASQFRAYPHFLFTPICRLADLLLPAALRMRSVPVHCGEMLVVAKRCG